MPENTVPTEPGYYWHRDIDPGHGEAYEWEPVRVLSEQDGPGIIIDGVTYQTSELHHGEWGPRIPDPEELQEKAEADAALDAAIKRSVKKAGDMIRDDLAAKFLVGILADGQCNDDLPDFACRLAYNYADAMLTKRSEH